MVTSVKVAIDGAKLFTDISKQYDQAELKLKIVELVSKLTSINQELLDLREQARLKEKLTFLHGAYFAPGDEGKRQYPICGRCFDVEGKAVHMRVSYQELGRLNYFCAHCKNDVYPVY